MMFSKIFTFCCLFVFIGCYNPAYVHQAGTLRSTDNYLFEDVAFLADDAREGRATGTAW